MTSQLDLDELLIRILQAAAAMLGGQVGLIALREPDGEDFQSRATFGVGLEQVELFAPLLQNILMEDGHGLKTAELDRRMIKVARALDIRLRQVIALPMVMLGDVVGVMFIFRAYQMQANLNDQSILQSFVDQAAIAVHNARLYQRVREEQKRLEAILDHSADGIMILDHQGIIQRFNYALGRITGWQPELAIGQPHDTIIRWKRVDQGEKITEALKGGWPHTTLESSADFDTLYTEGDVIRADKGVVSIAITYAPMIDEMGALRTVVANIRDISNFRQAQQLKSTFISVISHELRTPVALIKGYAGTLRREDAEWDAETLQEGLTVIEEEADRLTELIENLLAASKLQAEGLTLTSITDVRLDQLAQRSVDRLATQTEQHQFVVKFPPDFPTISGDENRLRQVFDNLISNAIKYAPNGGTITIQGRADLQSVSVSVADQGVGLSAEEQHHLFERFYRVDNQLSRKTQGAGLGLYLIKGILQAHHGTIQVSSQPGQGATFTFTLPRHSPLA
jgi:PAS domain S-box-containing protein